MDIFTSSHTCIQVNIQKIENFNFSSFSFFTDFSPVVDHYQGLSNDWDYGIIYCTILTKRVLLNKFPMLKNVIGLEYNKEYEIFLNPNKSIKYKVTLFDANHIAGSAMFLFDGPLGTFFHTGDARFDDFMFEQFKVLFPNNLGMRDFVPITERNTDFKG